MLSCEPVSDAALADELAALVLDALELADALAELALADALDALPDDEQPARSAPPASIAPAKPDSFRTSRLVYVRFMLPIWLPRFPSIVDGKRLLCDYSHTSTL